LVYISVVTAVDPIEELLLKAGDWGLAQGILLAIFGLLNISAAWHFFAQTVISITPPFTCATPGPSPCHEWINGSTTEFRQCASGWTFNLSQSPITLTTEASIFMAYLI
jgi:hypothetical protein